ncbi:MAG: MGMT family protein [Syntrophobacteraceae bacterium]|jgi:alkylated DNA nucleotide flippase Atl1|nr:MGMT family protein [Syntrophobacteraceae bacterium]
MAKKKSWREKLHGNPELPKIQATYSDTEPPRLMGWMVIPSPMEVFEIMSQVPSGKLITAQEIRRILARRHGAGSACPMTTGIFVNIAAQASEEALAEGDRDAVPYWRTLKTGGLLNEKYPGGLQEQSRRLEDEGHQMVSRGKSLAVVDYEDSLLDEDFFNV